VIEKETRRMRDDLYLETGEQSNYDNNNGEEEVESFRGRFSAQRRGPNS
jgi:hypothetical protein